MTAAAKEAAAAVSLLESVTVEAFLQERRESPTALAKLGGGAGVVLIDNQSTCVASLPLKRAADARPCRSVGDALAKLAEARVLSAPLVLRMTADASIYQVLAFISVRDFLRGLVDRAKERVPPELPLLRRMSSLSALGYAYALEPVYALHVADDGEMLYRGALRSTSLLSLVRAGFLRMPSQRPAIPPRHRVGVFDEHGHITDIISQTDITSWLRERPDALGPLGQRTMQELGLVSGTSTVVTVASTLPTDLALAVLAEQSVPAVGVVDAVSGVLVGCFSESDFRALTPSDFGSLALPVAQYLVYAKNLLVLETAERAAIGSPGAIVDPWAAALLEGANITVTSQATLAQAMDTLTAWRVHRIFVVDPATGKPLAVVSHTDVLGVVVRGLKLQQ
jgi:CBS domain-containing protein